MYFALNLFYSMVCGKSSVIENFSNNNFQYCEYAQIHAAVLHGFDEERMRNMRSPYCRAKPKRTYSAVMVPIQKRYRGMPSVSQSRNG